jgi:hypothetical protein
MTVIWAKGTCRCLTRIGSGRAHQGQQTHATHITELMDAEERGEMQNAFARMLADLEPDLYGQAIRTAQGNLTKASEWPCVTRLNESEAMAN